MKKVTALKVVLEDEGGGILGWFVLSDFNHRWLANIPGNTLVVELQDEEGKWTRFSLRSEELE